MSDIVTTKQELVESVGQYAHLVEQINLSELPTVIDNQVKQIEVLGNKIEDALNAAEEAKTVADEAENMPVKFGHKRKAIIKLQEVGQKSAEAIGETVDALKLSFEYERQLGEISKFLIAIAACSVVHTDQAIERINNAIQNRPANKPLNDIAKERLQQIIDQMKTQGDTIKKQEALAREMKEKEAKDEEQDTQISENAQDIDELERQDAEQDKLISEGIEKDKEQDAQISENAQDIDELERQDAEQDKLISEGIEKDKEQDAQITENAQDIDELERQDAEQDKVIAALVEKNKDQDASIAYQGDLLKEQAEIIENLKAQIDRLKAEKGGKVFMYIAGAVSASALILAVIQLFI